MEILKTQNYELFSFKKENREVSYNKVASLKSKLIDDGRQIIPIICNSKMEIIDGQHRFQALKELNWPIMYYVDDAVTGADLITINNTQKNWGMLDYIHYYASLGNVTFKALEKVVKAYDEFPLKVILSSIGKKYIKERRIKAGDVEFSENDIKDGIICLQYMKEIKDNIKVKIINPAIFFFLVTKIYYLQDIDKNRLYNNIILKYGTENYGNAEQCALVLEHFYNFHAKQYRYISNEILPKR